MNNLESEVRSFFEKRNLPLPGNICCSKIRDTVRFLEKKPRSESAQKAEQEYLTQRTLYLDKEVLIIFKGRSIRGRVKAVFIQEVPYYGTTEQLKFRPGTSIYSREHRNGMAWEWKVRVFVPDQKQHLIVNSRQAVIQSPPHQQQFVH